MTIHIQPQTEEVLKRIAHERGRDLQAIVDEAFDQNVTASSIRDVSSEQIAQAQESLLPELPLEND